MNDLFLFLFLVSIVCLIVGLIQPKVFSRFFKDKTNRKFVGLIFGIATVLFFILFGVTSSKSTPTTSPTATTKTETPTAATQKTETPATTTAPSYSFDVPSLIGKNIDQVRQAIGQPIQVTDKSAINTNLGDSPTLEPLQSDLNSQGDRDPWSNSWIKGNYELTVDYGYKSRQVELFNISLKDESPVANEQVLLAIGNLNASGGSNYKIQTTTCGSLALSSSKCNSKSSDTVLDVQAIPK